MKCIEAIDEIIAEVRTFGSQMLGTDNIGTCQASIQAIRVLRELRGKIQDDGARDYEWPSVSEGASRE